MTSVRRSWHQLGFVVLGALLGAPACHEERQEEMASVPALALGTTGQAIVGSDRSYSYMGIKTTTIASGLLGTTPTSPAGQPAQAGRDSQGIAEADFDGDGDLDLAWGNNFERKIKWAPRIGSGPGDFDFSQTHVIEASTPGSGTMLPMAVGDVDGDGTSDLVVSYSDSAVLDRLYFYRNVGGSGTAFVRFDLTTGLTHLGALAGKSFADANGDGKDDLFVFTARTALAIESQITVYMNTGNAAAPYSASSTWEVNNTNLLVLSSGDRWGALTAGDFDADGQIDIWAMGTITKVYFFKGHGNGTFDYPALKLTLAYSMDKHVIESFDIDKDATKDLLVASGSSTDSKKLRWYRGVGAGAISSTVQQTISSWGTTLAVPTDPKCHHKADGASCADGNVCDGAETCEAGVCKSGTNLAGGTSCSNGNVCDGAETCSAGACTSGTPLNCDDGNPCTIDACINEEAGCWRKPDITQPACSAIADYIGVADSDTTGGGIRIHDMVPGGFGPAQVTASPAGVGTGGSEGCIADMDADGIPDVVFGDETRGILAWARRIGPAATHFRWDRPHVIDDNLPAGGLHPTLCADINNDGLVDVIASSPAAPDTLRVYLNQNNGFNVAKSTVATGLTGVVALAGKSAGDFNGDNLLDVGVFIGRAPGSTQPRIGIFYNTGSSTAPLSASPNFFVQVAGTESLGGPDGTWGALAAGDFGGTAAADAIAIGMDRQAHLAISGTTAQPFFVPLATFGIPFGKVAATAMDVDDDGLLDVVLNSGSAADDYTLRVFPGTAGGGLSSSPSLELAGFGRTALFPAQAYSFVVPPNDPLSETVSLFEGDGFSGREVRLGRGSFVNSTAAGISNDKTHSIRVGSGVVLVLCQDRNYGGTCEVFLGDDPTLSDNSIGRRTTSVIVLSRNCAPPGPDQVVLYAGSDFSGPCTIRQPSGYGNAQFLGLPDNFVSSFRAGRDVEVEACTQEHFGGVCQTFVGDVDLVSTEVGINGASSFKIMRLITLPGTVDVPCGDPELDHDGDCLGDENEGRLAAAFEPLVVFHPDEAARRTDVAGIPGLDEPIAVFQVHPKGCSGGGCPEPREIEIVYTLLLERDGGYPDGTGCGGFDAHDGDNDNLVVVLRTPTATDSMGARVWRVWSVRMRLTGNRVAWGPYTTDAIRDDANIEMRGARAFVYLSEGKHHQYFDPGNWDDSPYSEVPYWDDCGDKVARGPVVEMDLAATWAGLRLGNVGEPGEQNHNTDFFVGPLNRFDNLFVPPRCVLGLAAWSTENFCQQSEPMERKWLSTPFERM